MQKFKSSQTQFRDWLHNLGKTVPLLTFKTNMNNFISNAHFLLSSFFLFLFQDRISHQAPEDWDHRCELPHLTFYMYFILHCLPLRLFLCFLYASPVSSGLFALLLRKNWFLFREDHSRVAWEVLCQVPWLWVLYSSRASQVFGSLVDVRWLGTLHPSPSDQHYSPHL